MRGVPLKYDRVRSRLKKHKGSYRLTNWRQHQHLTDDICMLE